MKINVHGFPTLFKLDMGSDGTVISSSKPWVSQMELSPRDTILHDLGRKFRGNGGI